MSEAPAASTAPVPALPIATPGSALPDLEGSLKKRGKVTLIGNPWKDRQFKQQREKLFYYKAGSKNPKVFRPVTTSLTSVKGHIDLNKVGSVKPSTNGGPHGIVLVRCGLVSHLIWTVNPGTRVAAPGRL